MPDDKTKTPPEGGGATPPDGSQGGDKTQDLIPRSEAQKAFEERDKAKALVRELTEFKTTAEPLLAKLKEIEAAQMSEGEKSAARIKELESFEAEAKKHRETFKTLLEKEIEGLSDDHKALIPALSTEAEKYAWVRSAKAKGLFGKPGGSSQGGRLPGNESGNTIKADEMANLAKTDFAAWKRNKALIDEGKLELVS